MLCRAWGRFLSFVIPISMTVSVSYFSFAVNDTITIAQRNMVQRYTSRDIWLSQASMTWMVDGMAFLHMPLPNKFPEPVFLTDLK